MSSGSYSAICVKACQTWALSQRRRSASDMIHSPLHDDFFAVANPEHLFSAFAHDRELQATAGSEDGHERKGFFGMVGRKDADGLVFVACGGGGIARHIAQSLMGDVGNKV